MSRINEIIFQNVKQCLKPECVIRNEIMKNIRYLRVLLYFNIELDNVKFDIMTKSKIILTKSNIGSIICLKGDGIYIT